MDADDFPIACLDQMLIGIEIITWAGAGGGRDEFSSYHPAQEFFPLNGDQVTQNLFTTVNIIGNRRDVQVLQEQVRRHLAQHSQAEHPAPRRRDRIRDRDRAERAILKHQRDRRRHVAAATPAFVADGEVGHFPRLFAAVLPAQIGHR